MRLDYWFENEDGYIGTRNWQDRDNTGLSCWYRDKDGELKRNIWIREMNEGERRTRRTKSLSDVSILGR